MQEKVRFYADYRIKQHAPLRLLRTRLFFLISLLLVYSQGGMVKAFASKRYYIETTIHRLQWRIREYLILFSVSTLVPQRGSILEGCLRH
jgi:hypothetical protein